MQGFLHSRTALLNVKQPVIIERNLRFAATLVELVAFAMMATIWTHRMELTPNASRLTNASRLANAQVSKTQFTLLLPITYNISLFLNLFFSKITSDANDTNNDTNNSNNDANSNMSGKHDICLMCITLLYRKLVFTTPMCHRSQLHWSCWLCLCRRILSPKSSIL